MPRGRVAGVASLSSKGGPVQQPPTFLARPFIPLDVVNTGVLWNPTGRIQADPLRSDKATFLRHLEGADEFFRRSVAAHPVLVRQSLHRLQQGHGVPTVAFCGRSNAGKSSLVNGLLFGRQVARASKTPGRTRQLFTFDLGRDEHIREGKGRPLRIVDLPGLGFAKGIDADQKAEWRALVGEYMERADNLRLVVIIVSLIDVIEGVKSTDEYLWKLTVRSMENRSIMEEGPPPPRLMVVLTKVDRVLPTTLHEEVASILSRIEYWQQEYDLTFWPYVHCVSAQDGHGMSELRAALVEAMDKRCWKKQKIPGRSKLMPP
ncbi:GTP-binding protein, putative [Perkinsus marinus ATCC 50983]|uniref:GTP-binding protein, putative n=1 Tax=Perkinsus marinus (strain ATCC 50983 / TXsc) TaxID=423536 RepID=C5LFD5_PERM5|nr:GTP-binding protein, putative [Perkinsus marinus ATCC 50983]EER04567.1 GTP-binding protein, putative [Perkinsus marinus ATCC 50983]|eukprot:XP_002772751.1 GTP-binding protein, putative [Perkinsus marinus ATCC 50983]